jgi:hypothetical protein
MKPLNEFFKPTKNNVLSAIRKGAEPTREYQRTPEFLRENVQKPKRARFKLWIAFNDGNTRTFYSYDYATTNGAATLDEWLGLTKLLRRVNKWSGKYKTAVIYCTCDPKADTQKKTYDSINIVGKFTATYQRHNPSVQFKQHEFRGVVHTVMEYAKFDKTYFQMNPKPTA